MTEVPDDDESHPIPHLGKVDVAVNIKNGAYYAIVVSAPLKNDNRTRSRLLKKIDNYLGDFYSAGFKQINGEPMPGKLKIFVRLHAAPDPGIIEFLETCRPWLADNKVELLIEHLDYEGSERPSVDLER